MDYKHYINGAFSGMFGIILSHPIDTIKTSVQDNIKIKYNISTLYRGILPALSGIALEKAIVFGTYSNTLYYLEKNNISYSIPLSGLSSGIMASLIVTPVERLKILSQTGHKLTLETFYPRSLYKGIEATFTREIPGFAIYFSTYNYLKNKYKSNNELSLSLSFLFGGISGAVSWVGIYPQDVVKTRMQAHNSSNNSFYKTIKTIYGEGGIKIFYKGFHLALLRAVPLHAGTFMMMELLNRN